MKSIVLAVLVSMLLAGSAFATGNGNNDSCPGNSCHGGDANVDVDVDQDVDVRNTNTTVVVTDVDVENTAVQGQGQEQSQGQFQAQGNSQKLTIEDAENPASSAANLFLANCTSGASAQGFGGGGSLGGPDDVCLLLNFAQVASMFGGEAGPEQSAWALKEAQNILKVRANVFRRMLQALPVVGKIM